MDYIQLKRATLLGKLTALLDLETLNAPPRVGLWPGVLPVLDVRELLAAVTAGNILFQITGTGWTTFATVPEKKTWRVPALNMVLVTGGALSISGFRAIAPTGEVVGLEAWTAAAPPRQTCFQGQVIELPAGWGLQVECAAFTAIGNMRAELLYKEFDAY